MRKAKDECGGQVFIPNGWEPGMRMPLSKFKPLEYQNPDLAKTHRLYVAGQPQGQMLGKMPEVSLRASFCEIARASTGMVADETDSTGYVALIAPGESRQNQVDMPKQWGCGLVGRGWARLAGIWSSYLAPPYRTGAAFNDIYEMARLNNALKFGSLHPFDVGNIVAIGRGRSAHMCMFIGMTEGDTVWTIDGGQEDKQGRQCVLWRERKAIQDQHGNILELVDDKRREVRWQLDINAEGIRRKMLLEWRLPWRFGSPSIPHPRTNKNN